MVRFRGGAAALRRELHGHWMAMAMLLLLPLVTAASATSLPATPHAIQCDKTDTGLDYAYGDLRMIQTNTSAACCAACQAEPKCVLWVKDTTDTATRHDCFLKATYSDNPCSPTPTGKPCRRKLAGRQSMAPTGPAPPPLPPPPPPVLPPIPPQQHFLPVHDLSKKFRNWTYFTGGKYGGFVVPPLAGNFTGQTLTDTAVVFEKTPEDTLPGRWRMWYLYFNSIKGENGYQTALATSDDLLNWSFNHGGDNGIIFKRNDLVGSYDYGGVTMGCGLWNSSDLSSPRLLRDNKAAIKTGAGGRAGAAPAHKYYALYGCYPSRAGYESGDGGEGVAWSDDGVVRKRSFLSRLLFTEIATICQDRLGTDVEKIQQKYRYRRPGTERARRCPWLAEGSRRPRRNGSRVLSTSRTLPSSTAQYTTFTTRPVRRQCLVFHLLEFKI
jgi:hypothetical protein